MQYLLVSIYSIFAAILDKQNHMFNFFSRSRKVDFPLNSITGINYDQFPSFDSLTSERDLMLISPLFRSSPHFIALAQEARMEDSRPYRVIAEIATNLQASFNADILDLNILPLKIYPFKADFARLYASKELSVFRNAYVFLQNVHTEAPNSIYETVFEIQAKGLKPVLVFPGKDPYFRNNRQRLIKLMNRNCLFQIDILALTGNYGSEARETAEFLLENERVKFISWQVDKLSKKQIANTIRVSEKTAELLTRLAARDLVLT